MDAEFGRQAGCDCGLALALALAGIFQKLCSEGWLWADAATGDCGGGMEGIETGVAGGEKTWCG